MDDLPATPIRNDELQLLTQVVDQSFEMAEAGMLVAGYDAVAAGLLRANSLCAQQPFLTWLPELVTHWRTAVESYCAVYGVPFF